MREPISSRSIPSAISLSRESPPAYLTSALTDIAVVAIREIERDPAVAILQIQFRARPGQDLEGRDRIFVSLITPTGRVIAVAHPGSNHQRCDFVCRGQVDQRA